MLFFGKPADPAKLASELIVKHAKFMLVFRLLKIIAKQNLTLEFLQQQEQEQQQQCQQWCLLIAQLANVDVDFDAR